MEHFKSLSYDGFGINGRDKYRTRLAKFAAGLSEEQRKEFGPLFAAAPEMLAMLKEVECWIDSGAMTIPQRGPRSGWADEVPEKLRAVIAKAQGGAI